MPSPVGVSEDAAWTARPLPASPWRRFTLTRSLEPAAQGRQVMYLVAIGQRA